jgi:urease gamma subunit
MRLTEREINGLWLNNAGYLAQKRLSRGLLLNYPETIALISSQVITIFFPDNIKQLDLRFTIDIRISKRW